MDKIIRWMIKKLYTTKVGHEEFVHLRAVELGSKKSENKRKAAKKRLKDKPNAYFGSSSGSRGIPLPTSSTKVER